MGTTLKNKTTPAEFAELLRGEMNIISRWHDHWDTQRFVWQIGIIVLGAGLYGAAMGWWRAPEQALFVAAKFPLILLLVAGGNALINGMLAPLLGINLSFRQSLSAILMSFTVAALILGAFSPVIAFLIWNAPPLTTAASATAYDFILLSHVAVIALAGITGNVRLLQLLFRFSQNRLAAVRVLCAWLGGNLFLGSQLTWIFRPFIGSPDLPVEFIRATAFHGNFYEAVLHALQHILNN